MWDGRVWSSFIHITFACTIRYLQSSYISNHLADLNMYLISQLIYVLINIKCFAIFIIHSQNGIQISDYKFQMFSFHKKGCSQYGNACIGNHGKRSVPSYNEMLNEDQALLLEEIEQEKRIFEKFPRYRLMKMKK